MWIQLFPALHGISEFPYGRFVTSEAPVRAGEMSPAIEQILIGIFVGGKSSRMGRTKGLLKAPAPLRLGGPDISLVERLLEITELELGCSTVLVGARPEYEYLKRPTMQDAARECGPLGGLVSLLRHAEQQGKAYVLAMACDLPYVSADLVRRLALFPAAAPVVCPQWQGIDQPLFARYSTRCRLPFEEALEAGRFALMSVICGLDRSVLPLSEHEAQLLGDWDRPEDIKAPQ
jgi:molybdenum cofactor guanylyltransferase